MVTIINSVAFENFYNYYGSYANNEYKFTEGINIINADNNMGKSKFYNGFLWLLDGKVYDSDDKCFYRADDSLDKMASSKAKFEGMDFKVGFKIVFTNEKKIYTAEIFSKFTQDNGAYIHSKSILEIQMEVDNKSIPILDVKEMENIKNKLIPLTLRNYALLQGESMERLVDLSVKDSLSDTIDALAGISILKGICEMSKKISRRAHALYQKKDTEASINNRVEKEEKEGRNSMQVQLDKLEADINQAKEELSEAQRQRNYYQALLFTASKRMGFRRDYEQAQKNIKEDESKISEIESSINSYLFDEDKPWLLMGISEEIKFFGDKRDKLIANLSRHENNTAIILPEGSPDSLSLERMLKNCVCEVCGREAQKGSEPWNHIKNVLERPKKVNTTLNDFSALYGELQMSAGQCLSGISKIDEKIEEVRSNLDETKGDLDKHKNELNDIITQLSNVGGNVTESGFSDEEIVKSYNMFKDIINAKEDFIKNSEKIAENLRTSIDQISKKWESTKKSESLLKYKNLSDTTAYINDVINQTKEDIFNRTIEVLEDEANKKYKALTLGNQSSGGKLFFERENDVINVSIRDKEKGKITGLGTGFQRMKQLAIVMAIISSKVGEEKKFDYPFISDAPFSEFGENFINNFFQVAPSVFTQSIILIKELYDPKADDFLTSFGRKILDDMNEGKFKGTFYVNEIKDKADPTNLITYHKCYKTKI